MSDKKIIPCKHCRHYQAFGDGYGKCARHDGSAKAVMRETDYCSYAEYCYGWEEKTESGLLDE